MTDYVQTYAARINWNARNGHKRKNRCKFKIAWRCLVMPGNGGIYGLHGAVAMEVYRYLCQTGGPMRSRDQSGWGDSGPMEVLKCSSGVNSDEPGSFTGHNWMKTLRKRFLHAMFESPRAQATVDWRKKLKLHVDEVVTIPLRHYSPQFENHPLSSATFETAVTRLLSIERKQLQHRWNTSHPDAVFVQYGSLIPRDKGWSYCLNYGYYRDSSSWQIIVARQERTENFHDFVVRCNLILPTIIYDSPELKQGWGDKPLEDAHELGHGGPVEVLQPSLREYYHGEGWRPASAPMMMRDYEFKVPVDKTASRECGHAIVSIRAKDRKEARTLLEDGAYVVLRQELQHEWLVTEKAQSIM